MARCEVNRKHTGIRVLGTAELLWVCRECRDILQSGKYENQVTKVEVPRSRNVAPFVMPLAGVVFVLTVISEVLFYWH